MKRIVNAGIISAALFCAAAQAGTLAINIAFKGASQRTVWQATLDEFKKANPDVEIKAAFIDEEAYKIQLPAWLSSEAPDIVTWHNGERMAYYASRGLFEDLSGDWSRNKWDDMYASSKDASSYKGKQYALPSVYYSWGMFYRKDLFVKAGISGEPKTWAEFIDASKKLKAAGISPFAVGGRDTWTLAGWFDYLDLRINGNVFHQQLMKGEIAYTDPRVKKVYATWKELLDNKYFIDNALSFDLEAAQLFMLQGKAGMMLMGTFIAKGFPAKQADNIGYFQFPQIDPAIPTAEEGPIESMHIPSRAKNKADAHRFLAFAGSPAISAKLAEGLGSLPANSKSVAPTEPISRIGFEILSRTKGGISQFYDRDMTKEMADEGMKGMQKFIHDPSALDEILNQLEATRKRIYKKS
jgi:multiple sugar transport system substrate-binding protein